jgi:hypothetical protein
MKNPSLVARSCLNSKAQIINAIREAHNELPFFEFNLGRIALIGKVWHLRLDMRECNGFNRLAQRHIRLKDCLAVRHIERMAQQKTWIQYYL